MTRVLLEFEGTTYDVRCLRRGDGWTVTVDGQEIPVTLQRNGAGLRIDAGGRGLHLELSGTACRIDGAPRSWRILDVPELDDQGPGHAAHGAHVRPPMNGKLERLLVQAGQTVAKGDVLFILEAMKMQNEVRSPVAGKVASIHATVGAAVEPSQVIVEIAPA